MQKTVNATPFVSRFPAACARIAAAIRLRLAASAAPPTYSVYVPGAGLTGDYATIAEAETARLRLPYDVRCRATVCDSDGNTLCR